jgi:hypothetical protein
MINTLKTLTEIKQDFKVVNLDGALDIDIKGDSKNPSMIVLNGIITEKSFSEAKKSIKNGDIIAMTRCEIPQGLFKSEVTRLFGDAYKIIIKEMSDGGFFVNLNHVIIYIKGIEIEKFEYSNEYFAFFANPMLRFNFGNLKARLATFKKEEPIEQKEPIKKPKKNEEVIDNEEPLSLI